MSIVGRVCAAAAGFLLLASCKGDSKSDPCAGRAAPLASAGADLAVPTGVPVYLSGQGSTVPGATLSYAWDLASRPPGSAVALSGSSTATASFVPDVAGVYVGVLTVSDGCAQSRPDVVVVTAGSGGGGCSGLNPVANAGPDVGVPLHQTVVLDGSGSVGQRGLAIVYQWTLVTRPPGSAATLSGATGAHPTFIPDLAGTYVASVIVNDGCGASAPDTVAVAAANRTPIAAAGADRPVPMGAPATVNGSGSTDPDGDPLTYAWTLTARPDGSTATLPGGTSATRAFTPDLPGPYVLTLVVSDGLVQSAPATVTLTAADLPPIADAGASQAANVGMAVQLDGTGSHDPNLTPLSYAWTLTTRPLGSGAALAGGTTATPTFVPDVVGTYVATLAVSDGVNVSAPDTVTVSADGPIALVGRHVLDAEFSSTLDRLVLVSASPDQLAIHDPGTGNDVVIALPLPPACVSVTPDGRYAAVGHTGLISWVDLQAGTLVKTLPVSADVFDVVAAGNGYAYAFPRVDQWVEIHSVNVATGVETLSSSWAIRAGTRAKLHPGGLAMYGADNGLSPADIEKYSISGGTAQFLYDSPYHGDYAMCGDLWMSEDGARIFTRCGNVFRTSPLQTDDMRWAGSLAPGGATLWVRWISDSVGANEIAVLPDLSWSGGDDTHLEFHERTYMARTSTVALPKLAVGGVAFQVHGRFVFHTATGDKRYVLVQVDPASGLLADYALVVY